MLPKIIVTDERFKNLSSDAKILYSCLLERTSLSFRNKWLDEENRVYIIFTVEEIMETLGRSNKTAVKILNELDSTSGGIGLIERKKRGLGKPNIIYVKDFMSVFRSECKNYTSEVKDLHSRSVETTPQEMKNVHGSNLNRNNTEYSNPDMSLDESDPQTVLFEYPKAFKSSYVTQAVRLEIGTLAAWTPSEAVRIVPDIQKIYPMLFDGDLIEVRTVLPERTFW